MLERYRDEWDIDHLCGRNELGSWPSDGGDHLLVQRGSLWGMATWADKWREGRRACLAAAATRPPFRLHGDPLVARHLALIHDLLRAGQPLS